MTIEYAILAVVLVTAYKFITFKWGSKGSLFVKLALIALIGGTILGFLINGSVQTYDYVSGLVPCPESNPYGYKLNCKSVPISSKATVLPPGMLFPGDSKDPAGYIVGPDGKTVYPIKD